MDNLLDAGGKSFYADSIGTGEGYKNVAGTILLTPDKLSKVHLVFTGLGGQMEWGVLNGTPEELEAVRVYGFRLLEPESKEVDPMVCFECKGVGTINDTYCPECGGTGKEIPKVDSKELKKSRGQLDEDIQTIRRETATQLYASMKANPNVIFTQSNVDAIMDECI